MTLRMSHTYESSAYLRGKQFTVDMVKTACWSASWGKESNFSNRWLTRIFMTSQPSLGIIRNGSKKWKHCHHRQWIEGKSLVSVRGQRRELAALCIFGKLATNREGEFLLLMFLILIGRSTAAWCLIKRPASLQSFPLLLTHPTKKTKKLSRP